MRPLPHLVAAAVLVGTLGAIALPGCGPAGATAPGPSLDARCSGTAPLAGLLTVEVRDAASAPRAGVKVTVRFPSPDEPAPAASAVRALSCSVPRGPEEGEATTDASGKATFKGLAIGTARVTAGALTTTVVLETGKPASATLAP